MPVRAQKLSTALKQFGVATEKPKGGSHWRLVKDGRCYPLPLNNGLKTEVSDVYVRGVCRAFDLDEAALREAL